MNLKDLPLGSSILLDACFLLDSFSNARKFAEFVYWVRKKEVPLVSIDLVKIEFVRSKSLRNLDAKLEYYNKIIEITLTPDKSVQDLMLGIIEEYGQNLDGVSVADLYLAVMIKKYTKLYLFTNNHKDFPTSVFEREGIVNFEYSKGIKSYALYRYKPKKRKVEAISL